MDYPIKLDAHQTAQYHYDSFIKRKGQPLCVLSQMHDRRYLPLLMHDHDFYEINIILEGEGMHYIENNRCPAEKGSVFILPPFVRHGYYSHNNDILIYNLELSKVFMNKYKNELAGLKGFSMLFEIEPKIRENFNSLFLLKLPDDQIKKLAYEIDELLACENSNYAGINVIKEARALAFIGMLTKATHEHAELECSNKHGQDYEITSSLIKCMEYIHENYGEKISIEELAQKCNMSKISFLRYFKKLFNSTPYDYIINYRIKKAKVLMLETDKTLSFIAQEVGFYDLSHFERFFIKFENCSPSDYRKLSSAK